MSFYSIEMHPLQQCTILIFEELDSATVHAQKQTTGSAGYSITIITITLTITPMQCKLIHTGIAIHCLDNYY